MKKGKPDHFGLRGKRPPEGLTTADVCNETGLTVSGLLNRAELGMLPGPTILGDELLWPRDTVYQFKVYGLSLPQTYEGMPPGYDRQKELPRWRANNSRGKVKVVRCSPALQMVRRGRKGGGK